MMDEQDVIAGALAERAEALQSIDQWIREVMQNRIWGWTLPPDTIVHQVRRQLLLSLQHRRFQTVMGLRQYVYKFAQQRCIEHLRQQDRPPEVETLRQELELDSVGLSPAGARPLVDQRRLFFQVFHALSDECRRLWQLIFLEERSYLEAAERLNMSEGQARLKFKQCKERALDLYRQLTLESVPEPPPRDGESHGSNDSPD